MSIRRRLMSTFSRLLPKRQIRAKFDAAQTNASNQNHWALADSMSARAAHSPGVRSILRKRSRYEAANNSWYCGILRTAANHIAGCGPRLQVLTADPAVNARIEKAWQQWSRSINLAEKLRVIVETYWRDGEVFVMRRARPRLQPISLDIFSIEAEQVASPFVGNPIDPTVEDGIRIDPSTNEIEFYIYDHHPGDNIPVSTLAGSWYSNRQVLHLFRADRPGQVRGIPRCTPALPLIPVMRRHMLATLFAAESAANQAMFMKTTSPAIAPAEQPQGSDFAAIEYARNMMTILPEGWDPFQMRPEFPSTTHEMFQRITLMEAFRCTNMPYPLLCGTAKESNLSSYRGDIKITWQPEVESEQDRIELVVMEPVLRWFLEDAVMAPGVLDGAPLIASIEHRWVWPPIPALDEVDEANAAVIRMGSGLAARSAEMLRRGIDAESSDIKAAADLGFPDVDSYKRAIAQKLLATSGANGAMPQAQPGGSPQQPTASGNYTELGQRAFRNNIRRITEMLNQVAAGEMTPGRASVFMQSIGVDQAHIDALLADVADGRIDDPQLNVQVAA